jgi:molybdate transport system substrate-binding protein
MNKGRLTTAAALGLGFLAIFGLVGAKGRDTAGKQVELSVFAAASMTETLTKIGQQYSQVRPDVAIVFTFDSSGALKTQIQEGADCDIFISAAQKQMDQLDLSAGAKRNPQGLDLIDRDSRFNLVENKVVLAVPEGNPADIRCYEDLGTEKVKAVCIGNEDVPVGVYSEEILRDLGIFDSLKARGIITYGSNVKEVTTQIKEASVDCGIIYGTDARAAGLLIVDTAKGQCSPVVYPAAMVTRSRKKEEAQAFLDYLSGGEARAVFEAAGFSMVECTLGISLAPAFVADFPSYAHKFNQRTFHVRLINLCTSDKKSSHKIRHKETPRVH